MLDNYPQVVIEVQHGSELLLVTNKAVVAYISLKFLQVQMVNFLGQQSTDDILKVQPPKT